MNALRPLILVTALVLASVSAAQSPPPLEAYGAMPRVDLLTISPSGKRVAYRMTTSDQDAIVVVDLEAGKMLGGIEVGEIAARELRFVDDDNLIIIAGRTARALGFRGQFDYSAAFRFEVSSQDLDQLLVRAEDLYPAQSGLGNIIAVTDGGKKLLMPAYHAEDETVSDPRYGVYSVNLDNGLGRLINRGTFTARDWFANSDGELLARVDFDERQSLYRISSLDESRDVLYEIETTIPLTGPVGVVPGGDALVFTLLPPDSSFPTYYRMDLDDGEITGPIMERSGSSVEAVQSDINQVVHGVRYSGFTPAYEFFDPELDARMRKIVNGLTETSTTLVSWSAGFGDLVVRISGGWNSGMYLLFRAGSMEPEIIAAVRPDIAADQVVPTVPTSYAARDGLQIPALVTALPELRENGGAPLLVLPHGGPASYDRLEFDWMAQYFASRGYVVLQPQFRGSSGFGVDFMRAGYGEWGGKMQTDIDDGVDHLVSTGLVDPDRVCIAGLSYGGYAALAAGAFSPDKYKCVASVAGISDLERMLKSDRRKYGRGHWAISYWERQYGGDDFDWDKLEAISPINFADRFEAPVLLVHGRQDTVVPIEQSKRMQSALRKADKDVTLRELKGEDHWLSYGDSRLETLRALAAFIEEHL
jgi:dienelactone hydrolase